MSEIKSFKVDTMLSGENVIQHLQGPMGEIYRSVLRTQELQIREKICELGWIPPDKAKQLQSQNQKLRELLTNAERKIREQSKLLVCYRVGKQPSGKTLDYLHKARELEGEIKQTLKEIDND